jgi:hypothetical protein
VGILIFVFKNNLLSYLSEQVFGVDETGQELVLEASASSVIDMEILDNQQFKGLSNQVLYFDFNHVGKAVINKNAATGAKAPAWVPVYLGNANPFFIPVEKIEVIEDLNK